MRRVFLFLLFCAVACHSQVEVPDENQEPGGAASLGPPVTIDHPSVLSENLSSLLCDDEGYVKDGESVRAEEMRITWDFDYAVDNPHHNVWIDDDKYAELRENYEKVISESPQYVYLSWSVYAGTTGISISSDKKLFGREAGENLSDKFRIVSFVNSDVLLSYPEGHAIRGFYDDKVMTVAEWGEMGGMLYGFSMKYDELPSEVYEDIEFSIEIKTTESLVLTGSVNVAFKN